MSFVTKKKCHTIWLCGINNNHEITRKLSKNFDWNRRITIFKL